MKLYRLTELPDNREGHFLRGIIPGTYINKGSMNFKVPGFRAHADEDVHVHDEPEVFVILQGKARVEFDDQVVQLTVGDVIVIDPGENHHLVSDEEDPCINLYLHAGDERSPEQIAD